ncbi:hypothetical protein VNO78_19311 [Psophocarpus tetragonolobus]|uniref:Ubiquitin-like domain-containing protein n=1 Tax=Psophocarpus tetragonolobus TaxID=3891 RepID=A0AAN9XG88_PSOTE
MYVVIVELVGVRGNIFPLLVFPFDTVLDLKVKMHKFFQLPISQQTFFFKGKPLQDDLHVWTSHLHPGSRIQLHVAAPNAANLPPPRMPQYSLFPPVTHHCGPLAMPEDSSPPLLPPVTHYYCPLGTPEDPSPPQLAPAAHNYGPLGTPEDPSAPQLAPVRHNYGPLGTPEDPSPPQLAPATQNYGPIGMLEDPSPPQLAPVRHNHGPIGMTEDPPPPQLASITHNYSPIDALIGQTYGPFGMPEFRLPPLPLLTRTPFASSPTQVMPSNRNELEEWRMLLRPSRRVMTMNVRVPNFMYRVPIEIELDDTVAKLKEKILLHEELQLQGLEKDRVVLQLHGTGVDLADHQLLRYCGVLANPDIDIILEESGKLKVIVLPWPWPHTEEMIEIEVNATDKVSVLREKLLQLHHIPGRLRLPQAAGYFFFRHKQEVLYEEESFEWNQVRDGDIIHTFEF